MRINRLQVTNLRNLAQVDVVAHPSINTLYGDNGAGKTSLLEAIVVLSRGRSFRGSNIGQLLGPHGSVANIHAEIIEGFGPVGGAARRSKIGLERGARDWRARKNGRDVKQLSELAETLAVVIMEPDSHALVSGPPDTRRRYLDWGVFHVKPGYLPVWRRYSRALKQRNAALRAHQKPLLAGLESIMAEAGEAMGRMRAAYVEELTRYFNELMNELSPGLGVASIDYRPGWSQGSLSQALRQQRDRDLERGSTQTGPHRADLAIRLEGHAVRDTVSRGEQKILATALVLAQARRQCDTGHVPVLLLDDLASEFDRQRFEAALRVGRSLGVQMWITGVEEIDPGAPHSKFHVEHGAVRKMV